MAKVLIYNIKKDYDIDKFDEIAKANNIEVKKVGKEDIDQVIGYLIGFPGFKENEEKNDFDPNLDFTFILFAGFERDELFNFLDLMRENNLSIAHKASETNNNINWTLRELLIENDKEGKTMGLINKINNLVDLANNLEEAHGKDSKINELIDEIKTYFDDASMFDLEKASQYAQKLENEVKRFYRENLES